MEVSVKYLPLTILILLAVTVCITLYLTLIEKHITGSLPYISDTGTLPPESCVFGQALNILWVLFSFAIYIKYRQTKDLFIKHELQRYTMLNRTALHVGLLAAFGCSIVANFQETNLLIIHWIGAVLVFGFGAIYQCIQTVLYINLLNLTLILDQRRRTKLRIGLSALSVITFIIFFICAMASYARKEDNDYLHWKNHDGGFYLHNISVVSEWICAVCTVTYLTLFYWEFAKITVHEPDVFVEDGSTNATNLEDGTDSFDNK